MPSPRDASPWMWALSGLMLILGTCIGLSALAVFALSPTQLREALNDSDMPAEDASMLLDNVGVFGATFAILSLLMVALALLIAVLGFAVRGGGELAVLAARVVMVIVAIGLGGLMLLMLAGGVAQGQLGPLLVSLLMLGVPTALAGVAAVKLFAARVSGGGGRGGGGGDTPGPPGAEPWNAHLRR